MFIKEINEAEEKLSKKEYYSCNMLEPYSEQYEIYDKDGNVVIDYLSVA